MKTVAIVQARMGSTRLPGKVLKDIGGCSALTRVVRRARRARLLDAVVVATTVEIADEIIMDECARLQVAAFRGSELDVLDRYVQAARAFEAEAVVRITSDCPLIDPEVIDLTVRAFREQAPDYASIGLKRTFPRGLDTEVMTIAALERAGREAREPYQRVHVTPYLYQHPELFRLLEVTGPHDYGHYRWTLDTPADLDFIRAVYARLHNTDEFGWRDVLRVLEREPELIEINRHVTQKALQEG